MPTVITLRVDPGGTQQYLTLAAAIAGALAGENGVNPNLVAGDQQLDIECRTSTGVADTALANINGFTTDATRFVRVFPASGHFHNGKYDATKYRIERTNGDGVKINDNFVRVEDLQAKLTITSGSSHAFTGGDAGQISGAADMRFKNCLAVGVLSGTGGGGGFNQLANDNALTKLTFVNCLAIGWRNNLSTGGTDNGWRLSGSSPNQPIFLYNCTAIECGVGFHCRTNARNKNCVAIGCNEGFSPTGTTHADSNTNASTLTGDAPGTGPLNERYVMMVDPLATVNGVPHYKQTPEDTQINGLGLNLSADVDFPFNFDIEGATRSAPWSLGCWHVANVAGQQVMWCRIGGVTTTTAKILAHLNQAEATVKLRYGTDPALATFVTVTVASGSNNNALFSLTNLTANTQYYFAVEIGATVYTTRKGSFKTFPGSGSLTLALIGDVSTGTGTDAWAIIRGFAPTVVVDMGDAMYADITTNDINLYRTQWNVKNMVPSQMAFFHNLPVAYMWDDHDYDGPDSSSTAASRPAAQDAYRENVPHYTLPAGDPGQFPVYFRFDVGRVRVLATDLRSARVSTNPKTMLGATQKQWFKDELLLAKQANQFVVWLSSVGWIVQPGVKNDSWGGFVDERREIADYCQQNGIRNLARVCADMHAIALDDGTNDRFTSDLKGNGFVTFHAAPMTQNNSTYGGPYSHGTFVVSEHSQWGLITIIDTGGATIDARFTGYFHDQVQVSFQDTYVLIETVTEELLTTLNAAPVPFEGWVRGVVEDAGAGTLPLGTLEAGSQMIGRPAGKLATRGGSRFVQDLHSAAATTVAAPAPDAEVTTITVVSTTGYPSVGVIRIDSEDISYTGKTATTFTGCKRGWNSTVAVSHSVGANVLSELKHVQALIPFSTDKIIAVGWSDGQNKSYAYKLKTLQDANGQLPFDTGSESTSRAPLDTTASVFYANTTDPPARIVAAELWERCYICDATVVYSARQGLLEIDPAGAPFTLTETQFNFGPGAGSLKPYCLEEYNNALFIAGYLDSGAGNTDRPEVLRHSFLGRRPFAADGFDKDAWVLLGAKGRRVTALRKGRGLLLASKENEIYRISGFGRAYPGWQYQVELVHNTQGFGATNPFALVHAEGYWYGISQHGPFRTDGFEVESLVLPRINSWDNIDKLESSWVHYHPDRNVVLFGLHQQQPVLFPRAGYVSADWPSSDVAGKGWPWEVWVWQIDRETWGPNFRFGADLMMATPIVSSLLVGPLAVPSNLVTTGIGSTGWTAGWTNGDTSTGVETEYEEKEGDSGTWTLTAVIPVAGQATSSFVAINRKSHVKYFWRVRHRKNGQFTEWRTAASVQTKLATPTVTLRRALIPTGTTGPPLNAITYVQVYQFITVNTNQGVPVELIIEVSTDAVAWFPADQIFLFPGLDNNVPITAVPPNTGVSFTVPLGFHPDDSVVLPADGPYWFRCRWRDLTWNPTESSNSAATRTWVE